MLSSGLSLMPDGLEAVINHQEMANLIAFFQAAIPTTGKAANPNLKRGFGTLPRLIESGGQTLMTTRMQSGASTQ